MDAAGPANQVQVSFNKLPSCYDWVGCIVGRRSVAVYREMHLDGWLLTFLQGRIQVPLLSAQSARRAGPRNSELSFSIVPSPKKSWVHPCGSSLSMNLYPPVFVESTAGLWPAGHKYLTDEVWVVSVLCKGSVT